MSDDFTPDADVPRDAPAPRRRRLWPWITLLSVVLVPLLLFGIWAAITLTYDYSEGNRVGYVLKFSEKGWLCKTWEGELSMATVPGVAPEKWSFSVRDAEVARRVQQMQGQQVQLYYEEHKGVPTDCFGETDYFVTDVKPVGAAATPVAPGPPAPAPVPSPAPAARP